MTTLHPANTFNVEASINAWFVAQVAAVVKPAWLPQVAVVFNMPETGISPPCISLFYLPGFTRNVYQGGHVGGGQKGARAATLLDVSCWVSRGALYDGQEAWNAQLMTLRSIVEGVFAGAAPVVIRDYWSSLTNPSAAAYKVDVADFEAVATMHDPNPDIERARYVARLNWTQRAVS